MKARLATAALAAALALSSAARAQQQAGFKLDRFEPGKPGSEWFMLDSLDLSGHWNPHYGLAFDWANKPLVIYNADGSENRSLVRNQIMAHLGFAVNLFDFTRLSFAIPVGAYQDGSSGVVGGVLYTAPEAGAFGDPRLGADVRLLGSHWSPFELVGGVDLWIPLGSQSQFTGDGKLRVEPRLSASGNVGWFAYAAQLGFQYHRKQQQYGAAELANQLTMGTAAGVRLFNGRMLIGPELTGATAIGPNQGFFKTLTTPFELIAGAHYRFGVLDLGVGTGPGLTRGYGSPQWRTVFNMSWGFNESKPSEEALAPIVVTLPPHKEVVPEPPPPEPPHEEVVVAKYVAPPPEEPEEEDDEVEIKDSEITIKEQVLYATDSAEILRESDKILTQLAHTLKKHREIASLRIEGHTDSQCARRFSRQQCEDWNLKLSQDRAKAAVDWLVAHGVSATRLESKGFGLWNPIDTNKTAAGRRRNRRVELHILARGLKEPEVN